MGSAGTLSSTLRPLIATTSRINYAQYGHKLRRGQYGADSIQHGSCSQLGGPWESPLSDLGPGTQRGHRQCSHDVRSELISEGVFRALE